MKTRLFLIIAFLMMTGFVIAQDKKASVSLTAAIYEEEVTGDLEKAAALYQDILKKYPDDRPVAAKALYHLGLVNEKMGMKKARDYFTRLVNTYPDQTEMVILAKARLKALGTHAPATTTMTTRRLENPPADVPVLASISPSGRYLTYWGWETGDLVQRDLQTGEKRPLTSEGTEGDQNTTVYQSAGISAWSADGKQIAYVWNLSGSDSRHIELRVVGFEGTKPRILFQDFGISEIVSLDWSPDGKYIVALALQRNGLSQIILVSTLDGSIRSLADLKVEISPTIVLFSPDNRHIAYNRLPDIMSPDRDIYMMDIDSGEETPLVQHPADDYLLGWSENGQWLVFASDRTGALGLWVTSISGTKIQGEPKLVKPGIDRIVPIGLTHEGTLFYGVVRATEDVFAADLDPSTGKVISPPKKLIESFEGGNFTPSYSPDGKYLAYVSRRGNSPYPTNIGNAICIRSLETGEEQVFYKEIWQMGIRNVGGPRWSPDSRFLVFGGASGTPFSGDYRIDLQTGEITRIYLCGPDERLVGGVYGPDGKYFSARTNSGTGITQIVVHDILSGQEKELFRYPQVERLFSLALSPDGRWLSFLNAGWGGIRSLNIMPASGGGVREIYSFGETKQGTPTYNHTWSPDGRYILFSAHDTTKMHIWDLWRVPVEGGKPEKMGLQRTWGIIHLTVRPDGRQVAFAGRGGPSTDSELWVLENFLPIEKIEESTQLTMRKLDYAQLSYPYAEISPDGKKIAYYIAGQTKQGIGILDLVSGTSKVLIESGAGGQASKVWSPQNNKIAYRLNNKEIHICDIDGAKTQLFYKSPEYKLYPTDWSRDGKKILCFLEAEDRTMRIGTIAADGQVKVLASGNQTEFVSEPKFSPDGNYVAFSRKDEKGNSDIYLLSSDGNQQKIIASHPGRDEYPVWSPDGKYLVFLSDRNRSADLWGIRIDQGKAAGVPFIIKRDIGWRNMIQDLTADGKLFIFTMGGDEPGNLFTIPVDQVKGSFSGSVTPVSVYPTDHSFPRQSPDGRMIAYMSRRGQIGWPQLFVMDEKKVERELPLQGHFATNVAWHPDNRSLFFSGWDKTYKSGVFEISLDNDAIRPVYSDTVDMKTGKGALVNINLIQGAGKIMFFKLLGGGDVEVITCKPDGQDLKAVLHGVKMPMWGSPSPDGNNICYRLGDSLMVISVSDGTTRHIGSSTINLEATWAPDGESLLFREGRELKMYSPEENINHTIYQAPEGKAIGGMEAYATAWSPDGKHIVITEGDAPASSVSPQKVIMIDADNGSQGMFVEVPAGYRLSELRWSPDGSRVLATGKSTGSTGAPRYEYWVMENFLPK